jgi:hypothetical protein
MAAGIPWRVYMRDIRRQERLSRDEETVLVAEMIARREEIADLLRALLLKACDTLGVDTGDGSRGCTTAAGRRSPRSIDTYLAELPKLREAHRDGSHDSTIRLRNVDCGSRGQETIERSRDQDHDDRASCRPGDA